MLGFRDDDYIVLHVGPAKARRNVRVLVELRKLGAEVFVVGRPNDFEAGVVSYLTRHGCRVTNSIFPRLNEVIAMCDLYVFPTTDLRSCVEMPLSVLEAMACNLPVVATEFYALPRFFSNVQGLRFVSTPEQLPYAVREEMSSGGKAQTREAVRGLSWQSVATRITKVYEEIS